MGRIVMDSSKRDNQLNIALDVSDETREQTIDLEVGFNREDQTWELIVKYSGSLDRIREELNASVVELMNEYAIITIPETEVDALSQYEEIEFIEKPKRLSFTVIDGIAVSCLLPLQEQRDNNNLSGQGVIVAIIDSGIDYSHPDFRNADGTTRILYLWDQTIAGNPPEGYRNGTLYTSQDINEALEQEERGEQIRLVPSQDVSGHGTHVAGICVGNGRAGNGRYRGVAYESDIIAVKLGSSVGQSFPKTTNLMEAINFVIEKAVERRQPIAVNISFGNNYGSHANVSLLEQYIDSMANRWKTNICIGTGNEGSLGHHKSGIVEEDEDTIVELAVNTYETALNLQIWKNYYDEMQIELISPGGRSSEVLSGRPGTNRVVLENTEILFFYGEPLPYNALQEIYIEWLPRQNYIDSGIWRIRLIPRRIIRGNYDMWLPTGEVLNPMTRFLEPTEETTLTIPSTASRAISVGAYDGRTDSFAFFSGRGFTRENQWIKPELVAPGVDITSCAPGGGYTRRSGTSMAVPFVTGTAALFMEWGIVRGNDPYLYGEKMKAYLIDGARQLPLQTEYPNPELGFGALCGEESLPEDSVAIFKIFIKNVK